MTFKYATNINSSGIVGLYTVLNLVEKYHTGKDILVIAEFLPGDESINFTSPYAGGNFSCITGDDEDTMHYDKYTYENLARLMKLIGGPEKGLDYCYSTEYWDTKPSKAKLESLSSYLLEYKVIPSMSYQKGQLLVLNSNLLVLIVQFSYKMSKFTWKTKELLLNVKKSLILYKHLCQILKQFLIVLHWVVLN